MFININMKRVYIFLPVTGLTQSNAGEVCTFFFYKFWNSYFQGCAELQNVSEIKWDWN